jgi:hypothetical protein
MEEGIIKDVYEKVLKELQTIITLSYLLMVAVGMLFKYRLYAEFGINIFDYADVFDFLIAPFSDPKILLFSFASLIFSYALLKLDGIWKKKFPRWYSMSNFRLDKKAWFENYRRGAYFFLFIVYLFVAAKFYAEDTAEKIRQQEPVTVQFSDNTTKNGILIGKTKDILFLLKNKRVDAIPLSSAVKEYQIK